MDVEREREYSSISALKWLSFVSSFDPSASQPPGSTRLLGDSTTLSSDSQASHLPSNVLSPAVLRHRSDLKGQPPLRLPPPSSFPTPTLSMDDYTAQEFARTLNLSPGIDAQAVTIVSMEKFNSSRRVAQVFVPSLSSAPFSPFPKSDRFAFPLDQKRLAYGLGRRSLSVLGESCLRRIPKGVRAEPRLARSSLLSFLQAEIASTYLPCLLRTWVGNGPRNLSDQDLLIWYL